LNRNRELLTLKLLAKQKPGCCLNGRWGCPVTGDSHPRETII